MNNDDYDNFEFSIIESSNDYGITGVVNCCIIIADDSPIAFFVDHIGVGC